MSLIKCRAIVLRTIDYSENSVILKCYTDNFGVQSYIINGVRSKKSAIRPSQLQPLTLLALESYKQENKNLHRIKELKCEPVMKNLHFDIFKSAVGIFMAELIYKTVREEDQVDKPLFEFLFHTIQILDYENEVLSNFPLFFMLQLTRYLGFYPKGNFTTNTNSLNINEGCFEIFDKHAIHQIDSELSEKISLILNSDFESSKQISLSNKQRTTLLEILITYYKQHISNFGEMNTNKVLHEVLS